jgi:hypothetical protein
MTAPGRNDNPYRVPLEQLEQEQALRTDQVVLRGDGMGPPPAGLPGLHAGDGPGADGDGE